MLVEYKIGDSGTRSLREDECKQINWGFLEMEAWLILIQELNKVVFFEADGLAKWERWMAKYSEG